MHDRVGRRLTALAFVCLTAATAALAQQRLGGVVLDAETDTPLAGATVRVVRDDGALAASVSADDLGRFAFPRLGPGRYTLAVSAPDHYDRDLELLVSPRATREIEVRLPHRAAIAEQVTVRAESDMLDVSRPATVTTLDRRRIEEVAPGRRVQLTDVVTPFVASAVGSHDNLVHLRGNELSLNTFVDGVSFFDNPHTLFTPGLSPDVVQSMNVITGGFPAEFGNRFGGILDVVTRSGFDADGRGRLEVDGGTYLRDSASVDYGAHTERFGVLVYGQAFQSARFLNTPDPERFHDDGRGARSFARLDVRPDEADAFRIVLTGDGTNLELPNTAEDEARGRDYFQRNREQTAILAWDHVLDGSRSFTVSAYERLASARLVPTSDPFSIQAGGLRSDLTAGLKGDYLQVAGGGRHVVKAGADVMVLSLREDFFLDPRADEAGGESARRREEADEEAGPEAFSFRGRRTGFEGSLYAQDEARLARGLTANVGLRYDRYDVGVRGWALSPRLNVAYTLPDGATTIHAAYNRFFSPPPVEDQLLSAFLGVGGRPPQIMRSNHVEAGVSRIFGHLVTARVTGYWRSDENSFETTEIANVRVFVPTTFARGKAYGLEFGAELREIERLGLSAYAGYTAQRAFQTGPVSGGFSDEAVAPGQTGPAAFDQVHTAVGGVSWRERRTGVFAAARVEYGSGTPATLPGADGDEMRVRLPGHTVLGLTAGVPVVRGDRRSVALRFDAENVTNEVYAIAKESAFTPVQYSAPRFLSASLVVGF